MRARSVFKTARLAHAAAGVVLSLILILLGSTGALLTLRDDYIRLTVPDAAGQADMSPAALANVVEEAEAAFGADAIRVFVFAKPGLGVHRVYLTEDRRAYLNGEGRIVEEWSDNERFDEWLFDLHHYLLAGDTGKYVAGTAGLAALVLMLAGLIAYWPTRRALKLGVVPKAASRPAILAAHRNLGLFAAPLLILLCLTGAGIIFHETTKALLRAGPPPPAPAAVSPVPATDWTAVLSAAEAAFPDAALRVARGPTDAGHMSIRLKQPAEWHPNGRTVVTTSPDGRLLATIDAQKLSGGERAFNAFYPLHAAMTGGFLYKIIVFAAGLAMTLLGVFGLLAFAKRFSSPLQLSTARRASVKH